MVLQWNVFHFPGLHSLTNLTPQIFPWLPHPPPADCTQSYLFPATPTVQIKRHTFYLHWSCRNIPRILPKLSSRSRFQHTYSHPWQRKDFALLSLLWHFKTFTSSQLLFPYNSLKFQIYLQKICPGSSVVNEMTPLRKFRFSPHIPAGVSNLKCPWSQLCLCF